MARPSVTRSLVSLLVSVHQCKVQLAAQLRSVKYNNAFAISAARFREVRRRSEVVSVPMHFAIRSARATDETRERGAAVGLQLQSAESARAAVVRLQEML